MVSDEVSTTAYVAIPMGNTRGRIAPNHQLVFLRSHQASRHAIDELYSSNNLVLDAESYLELESAAFYHGNSL